MKRTILTIFCLFFYIVSANAQVDTLIFGVHKYILTQTEKYFDPTQTKTGIQVLSEYTKAEQTVHFLKYKYINPWGYRLTQEFLQGSSGPRMIDTRRFKYDTIIEFVGVLDSLVLKPEHQLITPYIKSKNEKHFFCAYEMYKTWNDSVTIYNVNSTNVAVALDFNPEKNYNESFDEKQFTTNRKATFILTGLYYRIGEATYYLDRTIIIRTEW